MRTADHLAACLLVPLAALAVLPACTASGTSDPSQASPVRASETSSRGAPPPATSPPQAGEASSIAIPPGRHASRLALTPLSSVRRTKTGADAIDLRIDAFDESGARTRIAGELRIVLRADGADPLFSAFDVPILTKAQDAAHWDQTLEQYVVRVEPVWKRAPAPGARIGVTVTLALPSGPALEAAGAIDWWPPA